MAAEAPENQPTMEIVRVNNKDPEDGFEDIIYVNQNLETIMQKKTHQIAALTVAFIFWGIILFHAIVQAVVPLRKKWWIPFSMSTLISVAYFYTLEIILRDYNLVRHEYGLTLDLVHKGSTTSAENKTSRTKKNWFDSLLDLYGKNLYIFVLRSVMLAFSFLIMFACRSILRDQSP